MHKARFSQYSMFRSSFVALGLCLLLTSLACTPARETSGPTTAPAQPNRYDAQISQFEEQDRQNPPPKDAVLFLGSSSIRRWQDLADDFPDLQVINRGFGGSRIADSIHFLDRIVIPYRPRLIVFYAGENDIAGGLTPEQVFEDYKEFVTRVRRALPRTRIAFVSLKPSPSRAKHLEAFRQANELIRQYTTTHRRLSFIDVFTPMLGPDGQPRPELFVADRLHLNRQGYDLWKTIIAEHLK